MTTSAATTTETNKPIDDVIDENEDTNSNYDNNNNTDTSDYSTSDDKIVDETINTNNNNDYNTTAPNNTSNSDDDYGDYDELEDRDGEEEDDGGECDAKDCAKSFLDKWKVLYNEGKSETIVKQVEHINDTLRTLRTVKENLQFLLKPPDNSRERYKALEFFSELDLGLGGDCMSALTRMVIAMANGEIWALKFIDSMGRPLVSGFAEGLQSNFGEYRECLSIASPTDSQKPPITGQYCLAKAILPYPTVDSLTTPSASQVVVNNTIDGSIDTNLYTSLFTHYGLNRLATVRNFVETLNLANGTIFRLGICIPSQCTAREFESFLNKLLFPVTRIPIELGPDCQQLADETKLDNYQILSISILTILAILIAFSTCYEWLILRVNTTTTTTTTTPVISDNDILLTSFSLIRNTSSLFNNNNNGNKFVALDTIRLLLIFNVHAGHAFTYTTSLGAVGLKKLFSDVVFKVYSDNEYVFVRNPLIIDAFFTLSGLLLSYGLLRKLDKTNGQFSYVSFIIQRWLRFAVLILGSLLFIYLFPLTGSGPIWQSGIGWVTTGCQNPVNLLKMLLFVHNFRDDHKDQLTLANSKCNPPTWFLSSLLQLTIVAPVFVIIYYRNRMYGSLATVAAVICGTMASIAPYILFHLKPYLQLWDLETVLFSVSRSYTWYHFTPNNYVTAFFIGIGTGFCLYKPSGTSSYLKPTNRITVLIWLITIPVCTSVYFYHNTFWRLDQSAPLASILLWHSLGKLVFCLGIAWIYYALCTGRAGILNTILTWPIFRPLARLSFGIYILHYMVVMHRIFTNQYTYEMTDKYMFEHLIVDLLYDIILAYIFYVVVECPIASIIGLVFKSMATSPTTTTTKHQPSNYVLSSNGIKNVQIITVL
ncbi:nose resistant to fluoxetine protein 6-like [Oppia nitens]|uniref:nose resistant to fluoxetine protein 6-like n=1 Tax=Oppia nitens TaxID=1686743 RepID=UPI0023DC7B99|nr:nose resistant to fluoxetine protein 6-like [Oppia nitens]